MQIFRLNRKEYVAKKVSNELDNGKKSKVGPNMIINRKTQQGK